MNMQLQKFGDWEAVARLADTMQTDVITAEKNSLKQVADLAAELAKEHINRQNLGWQPLDPEYAEQKSKEGLSSKTLVATGAMSGAINSKLISVKQSFAGIGSNEKNDDGESLANISRAMEFGVMSKAIPARPLWQPVYKEVMDFIIKKFPFALETLRIWKTRTGGKG